MLRQKRFAFETGKPETHGDFAAFRKAVTEKSKPDLAKLKEGEARLTAADGTWNGLKPTLTGRPIVFRGDKEHDWKSYWPLWSGESSPIILKFTFSVTWRLRECRLRPGQMDFPAFVANATFCPLSLDGVPLMKSDLAIGESALHEAPDHLISLATSMAQVRHRAINWLCWGGSWVHTDTAT